MEPINEPIVEVRDLKLGFSTPEGPLHLFLGLDLEIRKGEILGLVGESGCGKTTLAYSIVRLLPENSRILGGDIYFKGQSILSMSEKEIMRIRGRKISMVFQDPMTSLNPVYSIKDQMSLIIRLHTHKTHQQASERTRELLRLVELPDPDRVLSAYPHQLSGGMQQRIMIAMALTSDPELLIADEPTTAIDASIQAQILDLLIRLKHELGFSVLLVTHNLDLVEEICDRISVMYAGNIVEEGPAKRVINNPRHPYTMALIKAIPRLVKKGMQKERLKVIPGELPSLIKREPGCSFTPRCDFRMDVCAKASPKLVPIEDKAVKAACYLYPEVLGNEDHSPNTVAKEAL